MSSFVSAQFTAAQQNEIEGLLDDARSARPIPRVTLAFEGSSRTPFSTLDTGEGRGVLGTAHHHGEWINLAEI